MTVANSTFELNLDGLVGPTHHYAGLSHGNLASQKNALTISNPRQAALQSLAKMKFLHDLGLPQAVIPPHPRPNLNILRQLGFTGPDPDILHQAHQHSPRLLSAVYSASSMWAANAATVSPSSDTADHRVHFTPANLITQFHRSLEPVITANILRQIFPSENHFAHHAPLPAADTFADEGAANHMRLASRHDHPGLELFVYGRSAYTPNSSPSAFPARQTREACEAISRLHQLNPAQILFLRQSAKAIDAGAFHNDVVAVANEHVLLCHTSAWDESEKALDEVRAKFAALFNRDLTIFAATENDIPLTDAVSSYLFNSQLITTPDGSMSLICPTECGDHPTVQNFLTRILTPDSPIQRIHYLDVRESMKNGGGPACLRLRVVLTPAEFEHIHPSVLFTDNLYNTLTACIQRRYRDHLTLADLPDPQFARESADTVNELHHLLGLRRNDE